MATVVQDRSLQEVLVAQEVQQHKAQDTSSDVEQSNNNNVDVESLSTHQEPEAAKVLRSQQDEEKGPLEKTATTASDKPYSSFGKWEKKFIVLTATLAAFFSPLSAQIYFPALTTMAKDLNVSADKINLTMTTYMVFPTILTKSIFSLITVDLTSYRSGFCRRLCRHSWPSTRICDMLHHLHRCLYSLVLPEQLRRAPYPQNGSKCGQ